MQDVPLPVANLTVVRSAGPIMAEIWGFFERRGAEFLSQSECNAVRARYDDDRQAMADRCAEIDTSPPKLYGTVDIGFDVVAPFLTCAYRMRRGTCSASAHAL